MKRLAALILVVGVLIAATSAADAAGMWIARLGSTGAATLRIGAPDRLAIGVRSLHPSTTYTVSLRRGTCASAGTLVGSYRIATSAAGAISRTVRLTTAQTRAARLPLAIRVGSRCATFAAPAVLAPPSPSPSASPSPSPSPGPSPSPSPSPSPTPTPYPMPQPSM
jgi:hypothetical protein